MGQEARGLCFFFQAEDGIRDAQESRGLEDVYRGQTIHHCSSHHTTITLPSITTAAITLPSRYHPSCFLYPSYAADDPPCVDLGGSRIIKKKKTTKKTTKTTKTQTNKRLFIKTRQSNN